MPKIETYPYPFIKLSRAIEIVRRICEAPYKGEISVSGLAQELHMSEKGGGYIFIVSALKDYKLLAGRGTLKATDLAKKIVVGSPEEANKARVEAFLNVEIFRMLYERIGVDIPELEQFSVVLRDLTKADPLKVKEKAKTIRNLYLDAVPYLKSQKEPEMEVSGMVTPEPTKGIDISTLKFPEGYEKLTSDDFIVAVRKDQSAIDFAQSQIDSWFKHLRKKMGTEEPKESKKKE